MHELLSEENNVETVVQLLNIAAKPDITLDLEVDVDEFYEKVGSLSNFTAIAFENPDSVDADDERDAHQEAIDNAPKEESDPNDDPLN